MSSRIFAIAFAVISILGTAGRLLAGAATQPTSDNGVILLDDDDDKPPATSPSTNQASGRYFLGLLDHGSSYGRDFFHDPFLGPEFDAEQQLELDYLRGEKRGVRTDEVDAGFQWNVIGELSVAGEFGWSSVHQTGADGGDSGDGEGESGSGFEDVDLAVYHPIVQFVSDDRMIDYTAAARLDVGIPTHTPVSGMDAQLTPYLGHLLRIGDHVSVEAWTGSQFTIAPRQTEQLIYGASFGYEILRDQLPVPLTDKLIPVFELDAQTPLSAGGQDVLFGVGGIDINFQSPDDLQPRIEIGCQFPIDKGARDQIHWGIITELLFEF